MRSDVPPVGQTGDKTNSQETEGPSETSHNGSPLLSNPWKPCRRSREFIKECLLAVRFCLGSVCSMEWYGYAALGIVTAVLSFLMDFSVTTLLRAHWWLYTQLEGNVLLQFFCWTLYPSCLCAFASSFSHSICPFSTGSGIPEVRVILAGIEMPHYLSLTNMFTKFLGLICTLAAGSTVFLGKVGPFVHLSTMMGAYLSQLCTLIKPAKEDKAAGEMLVVAAAVGVASCFGAPISGVLFSVEVMCSHFALKHYCPCFFSAACSAVTFRLFSAWSGDEETLQALFKTNFPTALPFYPLEILLFVFLGLLCGAASCCYLLGHRWVLRFTKTCPVFIEMLTTQKGLYSGIVVFFMASVTFPHSAGQYMAATSTMKQLLTSLLDTRLWCAPSHNASVLIDPLSEWSPSGTSVWLSLAFFLLMKMWMLVLACTLPLPAGYFMPVFVWGAALGRLIGEGAAYVFIFSGWTLSEQWASINPGGYALAGAAAVSGAVTHTLSPALVAIELTGQFTHAVPILITTLLANAVARSGDRPSFYDALSISKRLPHLPSLRKASPQLSSTPVGLVLGVKPVQLQKADGPEEIQQAVSSSTEIQIPVVESTESQVLLGFVLRVDLLRLLRHRRAEIAENQLDRVCHIHPATVLLSPHNTVQQALTILSVTEAQTLFVADRGRLVGLITWTEMKRILEELARDI